METGDRIRMVERMREENGEGPLLSVRNLVKSLGINVDVFDEEQVKAKL